MKKISFIFTYRDIDNFRRKNAVRALEYYRNIYPQSEIIFVEEDAKPNFIDEPILKKINAKYTFIQNGDVFNKPWALNIGAKQAKGDILAFVDIDIIIEKEAIESAIECIKDGTAKIVSPFGHFYDLTKKESESYDQSGKFSKKNKYLERYFPESNPLGIVGAICICEKKTFNEIHGYNENFTGWGSEDDEFIVRAVSLGYKWKRLREFKLFHFYHDRDIHSTPYHSGYINNLQIFCFVLQAERQVLKSYTEKLPFGELDKYLQVNLSRNQLSNTPSENDSNLYKVNAPLDLPEIQSMETKNVNDGTPNYAIEGMIAEADSSAILVEDFFREFNEQKHGSQTWDQFILQFRKKIGENNKQCRSGLAFEGFVAEFRELLGIGGSFNDPVKGDWEPLGDIVDADKIKDMFVETFNRFLMHDESMEEIPDEELYPSGTFFNHWYRFMSKSACICRTDGQLRSFQNVYEQFSLEPKEFIPSLTKFFKEEVELDRINKINSSNSGVFLPSTVFEKWFFQRRWDYTIKLIYEWGEKNRNN